VLRAISLDISGVGFHGTNFSFQRFFSLIDGTSADGRRALTFAHAAPLLSGNAMKYDLI
jgi:hypothetical protein